MEDHPKKMSTKISLKTEAHSLVNDNLEIVWRLILK